MEKYKIRRSIRELTMHSNGADSGTLFHVSAPLAIEEALSAIEDASYNVAQGFKVYKELKELRNKRRQILLDLNCVQTIVEKFDCGEMLQIYEEIADQIQTGDDASTLIKVPAETSLVEKKDERADNAHLLHCFFPNQC